MLTLISDHYEIRTHNRYGHYQCDCGNTVWTRARRVERGLVDNCGCVKAKQFQDYLKSELGDAARQKAYGSRMKRIELRKANIKPESVKVKTKRMPMKSPNLCKNDPEHKRWMQEVLNNKAQREAMMGRV